VIFVALRVGWVLSEVIPARGDLSYWSLNFTP